MTGNCYLRTYVKSSAKMDEGCEVRSITMLIMIVIAITDHHDDENDVGNRR